MEFTVIYVDVDESDIKELVGYCIDAGGTVHVEPYPNGQWRLSVKNEPHMRELLEDFPYIVAGSLGNINL